VGRRLGLVAPGARSRLGASAPGAGVMRPSSARRAAGARGPRRWPGRRVKWRARRYIGVW